MNQIVKISPKEQEEILEAYFDSEGMELKDLFDDKISKVMVKKMTNYFKK